MEISPELMEKAKACTSPEELLDLAREEGYELSENELDGIVGGWGIDCTAYCKMYYDNLKVTGGDARDGIDPAFSHADFVNGIVRGGELG